jgi:hypothetical protein
MSRVAATFPNSNADTPTIRRPSRPVSTRPYPQPQWLALPLLSPGRVADSVDDGQGGEQAGDDRQGDGGADPDQADQDQGEQGTGDGAEVVHGPLEPVGAAVDDGRDDVG